MRKDNSDFSTAFVSEAGSYIDNRDYFAFMETDDMACYVLADGLDSDQELRSAEMVVKTVLENFMEKPSMSKRRLMRDLREAQEWLQFESRRVRLKASLLMVVTNYNKMLYVSCGNVRLYHFRNGRLNFRSKDHSLAQSLADDGRIPDEATSTHEERGNLLEYLGNPNGVHAHYAKKTQLADGDVILLATSGMWEDVELAEMLGALEEAKDPVMLTDTLEEVLLSKQHRTVNNYTAAAIYVNKVFQEKPKNRRKLIKRILIALLVFIVVGGGAWITLARMAANKAAALETMIESAQAADDYARTGDYAKALKSYSEAKNAAVKINDKIHKRLYTAEQKLSQLMVDGDGYVEKADFTKAEASYAKARKSAGLYPPFNVKDIEHKIDQLDSYAETASWMKDGDLKFQGGDYTNALKLYKKANKAAMESGYTSAQKELEKKITETNDKLTAIQQQLKEIQAGKLQAKGDRMMKDLDYEGAIEAYSGAQEIYQEIDKLESVLALERSIAKAEEKQSAEQQKNGQLPAGLGLSDGALNDVDAASEASSSAAAIPAAIPAAESQMKAAPTASAGTTPAKKEASSAAKSMGTGDGTAPSAKVDTNKEQGTADSASKAAGASDSENQDRAAANGS